MTSFVVPIKTPNPTNGSHGHWRSSSTRVKKQREAAFYVCPRHPLPCTVTMTRLSPGLLDDDNLRPALKAIRDGIASRLGVADNDPRIRFEYDQRRCKPGGFGVEVSISPLIASGAV